MTCSTQPSRRRLAPVILLILGLCLSFGAWQAAAQESRDEPLIIVPTKTNPSQKISFSFRGASIDDVLRFMARATGKIIYKDPAVQMSVTILNQSEVSVSKALKLLSLALSVRGFSLAEDEDAIVVSTRDDVQKRGGQVIVTKDPADLPLGREVLTVVAPLEFADVVLLQQQLQPYFPQGAGILTSNADTNTLVMTDEATQLRRVLKIVQELDKDTAAAIITKVFILKNANAQEVTDILTEIFKQEERPTQNAGARPPGQPMPGRPPMGPTQAQARARVRASADTRSNAVVVSASPTMMPGIGELIDSLDTDVSARVEYRHVKLEYADPVAVVDTLLQLLQSDDSGGNPFARFFGGTQAGRGTSAFTAPKFVADVRTNSIIMSVPSDTAEQLEALIKSLDREADVTNTVKTYKLQHAVASEVSDSLTNLFFGQFQNRGFGFALFGGSGAQAPNNSPLDLLRQVTIIPHDPTNQLLVSGPQQTFTVLDKLIKDLDKSQPQVFIEVVIADITLDDLNRYGIEFEAISGSTTSSSEFGLTSPTADTSGFNFSVLSKNFNALFRALKERDKVNVISTPHVMVSDNTPAVVSIGESIPFPANTSVTQGVVTTTVDFQDVAITLNVTPHISPGDEVMLDIDQVVNSLIEFIDVGGGARAPRTTSRHAGTTVTVDDSQTVVIGGIISDEDRITDKRVPLLSEIPLLGNLFRFREKKKTRSELVVFITPHIVRDPQAANAIRAGHRQRLPVDPFESDIVQPLRLKDFELHPPGNAPIQSEPASRKKKGKRRRRQKGK